jgi:outer membrane protein TolC
MSRCPRKNGPRGAARVALTLALVAPAGPALAAEAPAGAAPAAASIDDRPAVNLGLRDCMSLAMSNNLSIAVQRYNVDINAEGIDISRSVYDSTLTSTFLEAERNSQNVDPFAGLPVIESKVRRVTATWTDPTIWGGSFNLFFLGDKQRSNIFLLDPAYNSNLNFWYTQSLLRNLGLEVNRAPIVIAQNTEEISRSQFLGTVQDTIEGVEFAYWDLVFTRLNLEVQRNSLRLAGELLKMNRAKVEVGTMAPIDITQAEAGVADRVEGVIVAEAAVLNAEDALRQLLNPAPDSPIWTSAIVPSDSPSFTPLEPDVAAAIEAAMQHRPDLEQQRLTVESNALQERIDRQAKRLDWTVRGDYGLEGVTGVNQFLGLDEDYADSLRELDDTEFGDWALQTTLTIPIGNRDLKARYAQSMLRHRQSQTQMDSLVLAAEIDVRRRVRDVSTNVKRVEAAKKNRELQQENVDAEQKKFENGMSTSFQVLQVQDTLRTAEGRENLAIVDYTKSLAALEKAKGTLLQARNIQVADAAGGAPGGAAPGSPLRSIDLRGVVGPRD